MSVQGKLQRRARRKHSIRKKLRGTAERPRLTVFRSLKHIYVQAIDDDSGRTLAHAGSLNDEAVATMLGEDSSNGIAVGAVVGKVIAQRLKEQNITSAVFDRSGYLYHGRVKAVADGAREHGLVL
jgi:large subunit ribosomal protein L18